MIDDDEPARAFGLLELQAQLFDGGKDCRFGLEVILSPPEFKAEDKFIEVRLEVLAAQPVIDAQGPDF